MSIKQICSFTFMSLCLSQTVIAQSISGKIVNTQGQVIAGASIELGNNTAITRSNNQGEFSFNNIATGTFELHVSAKRYSHINKKINISDEVVAEINIILTSSVMEVVDVHATPLHSSTIESALPINVITADELKLKQAATLGETLKNEVGVHSSYYGPVASTPIIRGLDGPRVLITQNGLDVGDASRIGPDHIVAAETSTATQIEVLRGPATLFYGSGAIGGVVNVVDDRVPTSSNDKIDYLLQYNDVSNEKQASINLQTGTDNIALHLDGFWRDSKDYKLAQTEGDIHQGEDHEEEAHEGHEGEDHEGEEEHHAEESDSRLANSATTASGATFGASYLFDAGFIGFSYGRLDREYGIPGHAHDEGSEGRHEGDHEEDHEGEEGVFARMKQDRVQLLGDYNVKQSFLSKVTTKLAFTDYQHQEVEAGLVGTTFINKSREVRADLYHQDYLGWQGAWTFHSKSSDFKAQGEEAFSPPSKSKMLAFAWLEEKHFGDVLVQLGARVERVTLNAQATKIGFLEHGSGHESEHELEQSLEHSSAENEEQHSQELVTFEQGSFTPISSSLGLVWDYQTGYNLGFSAAFSQRAPSAGELFSFGPHIGTNTFEVGALFELEQEEGEIHVELTAKKPEVETSFNLDLTWRKFNGDFGFVISAFYNQVDDYYYQQDSALFFNDGHSEVLVTEHEGESHEESTHEEDSHDEGSHEAEGLPILVYQQNDVTMYGIEAQFIYQISENFKASLLGDSISAKLKNGGYLPRIPPKRLAGIIHYQTNDFDAELSINHYFEQNKVALLESVTKDYTLVDAHFNYYVAGVGDDLVLYVKAQNLTNEYGRVHSSFLKEVAPLPGRNFSLGIRGSF